MNIDKGDVRVQHKRGNKKLVSVANERGKKTTIILECECVSKTIFLSTLTFELVSSCYI